MLYDKDAFSFDSLKVNLKAATTTLDGGDIIRTCIKMQEKLEEYTTKRRALLKQHKFLNEATLEEIKADLSFQEGYAKALKAVMYLCGEDFCFDRGVPQKEAMSEGHQDPRIWLQTESSLLELKFEGDE